MKKKDFVTLIMSTIGGILFALGMCMALLPEWGVFSQGVVIGAVGAVVLLAMLLVRRRMDGSSMKNVRIRRFVSGERTSASMRFAIRNRFFSRWRNIFPKWD